MIEKKSAMNKKSSKSDGKKNSDKSQGSKAESNLEDIDGSIKSDQNIN